MLMVLPPKRLTAGASAATARLMSTNLHSMHSVPSTQDAPSDCETNALPSKPCIARKYERQNLVVLSKFKAHRRMSMQPSTLDCMVHHACGSTRCWMDGEALGTVQDSAVLYKTRGAT